MNISFVRFAANLTVSLLCCHCGEGGVDELDPLSVESEPTYGRSIRPLMQYYCTSCHAEDTQLGSGLAGYDYSSYGGVVGGFSGIEQTVFASGNMPPGGAPKLSATEKALLKRWQQAGFPP